MLKPRNNTEFPLSLQPQPSYNDYLRLQKSLITPESASELEIVYEALKNENFPRYLVAAGWAAAEAAIMNTQSTSHKSHELVGLAHECWDKAEYLQEIANDDPNRTYLWDEALPFRAQVDKAFLQVFHDMIDGNLTEQTRANLHYDLLEIAQRAAVRLHLATTEKDDNVRALLSGFLHENNGLLTFARLRRATRIAIPSTARADNGHFYPEDTHDLQLLQLKWGRIIRWIPLEIKAAPSKRDRERYKAVLVRGKMHLTTRVSHSPIDTVLCLTNDYNGTATKEELEDLSEMTAVVDKLVQQYKLEQALAHKAVAPALVAA